jgi:DNA repair protein RadD
MLILRKYQELAVESGYKSLKHSKNNEVIVAPTASGKSVIISELCHRLDEPTLILQPTKEILEQNYEKLRGYGVDDIGIYSASMTKKIGRRRSKEELQARTEEEILKEKLGGSRDIAKFTYATIGSIYKYPELFKHFKHVLVDECHLVNPQGFGMYKSFFAGMGNPSILGLTATPYRLCQKYFREDGDVFYTSMLQVLNRIHPFFFKSFAFKITNQRLFDEGYLAPINYVYPEKGMDLSSLKLNTTGGDFDETALEEFINTPKNVTNLVEAIIQEDHKLRNNLIFCSSIQHATSSAEMLAKMGYDCEVITSKDSSERRAQILADFRSGKIKRLLNVGVLTTGFDMPTLYGVTLARPTMSLALYYQIVGRMIRLDPENPEKVGTFIDITNASKRMGRIETIKLTKDGYKDQVETEVGVMSGMPLFTFQVTNRDKLARLKK